MNRDIKPGFTIIEFVIGIMISSILLTASLTIYNQISKSSIKIQNITSQDLAIRILQKRISDDLMGLCPVWFKKEDLKDSKQAKNNDQQLPNIKNNNYFYAQTNNEQLDFMTFISCNTLQAYPTPEHQIARVVYILKKDDDKENFFKLQRKEETQISNEFNIEKIKEGKFYTVIENIKKCVVEYGFIEKTDSQKEKIPDKEQQIKWVKQWTTKQQDEKEKKEKEQKDSSVNMPDIIKINITLQELINKPESEHIFYSILPQSKNVSIKSLAKQRIEKETAALRGNLSSASNIMGAIDDKKAKDVNKGSNNA